MDPQKAAELKETLNTLVGILGDTANSVPNQNNGATGNQNNHTSPRQPNGYYGNQSSPSTGGGITINFNTFNTNYYQTFVTDKESLEQIANQPRGMQQYQAISPQPLQGQRNQFISPIVTSSPTFSAASSPATSPASSPAAPDEQKMSGSVFKRLQKEEKSALTKNIEQNEEVMETEIEIETDDEKQDETLTTAPKEVISQENIPSKETEHVLLRPLPNKVLDEIKSQNPREEKVLKSVPKSLLTEIVEKHVEKEERIIKNQPTMLLEEIVKKHVEREPIEIKPQSPALLDEIRNSYVEKVPVKTKTLPKELLEDIKYSHVEREEVVIKSQPKALLEEISKIKPKVQPILKQVDTQLLKDIREKHVEKEVVEMKPQSPLLLKELRESHVDKEPVVMKTQNDALLKQIKEHNKSNSKLESKLPESLLDEIHLVGSIDRTKEMKQVSPLLLKEIKESHVEKEVVELKQQPKLLLQDIQQEARKRERISHKMPNNILEDIKQHKHESHSLVPEQGQLPHELLGEIKNHTRTVATPAILEENESIPQSDESEGSMDVFEVEVAEERKIPNSLLEEIRSLPPKETHIVMKPLTDALKAEIESQEPKETQPLIKVLSDGLKNEIESIADKEENTVENDLVVSSTEDEQNAPSDQVSQENDASVIDESNNEVDENVEKDEINRDATDDVNTPPPIENKSVSTPNPDTSSTISTPNPETPIEDALDDEEDNGDVPFKFSAKLDNIESVTGANKKKKKCKGVLEISSSSGARLIKIRSLYRKSRSNVAFSILDADPNQLVLDGSTLTVSFQERKKNYQDNRPVQGTFISTEEYFAFANNLQKYNISFELKKDPAKTIIVAVHDEEELPSSMQNFKDYVIKMNYKFVSLKFDEKTLKDDLFNDDLDRCDELVLYLHLSPHRYDILDKMIYNSLHDRIHEDKLRFFTMVIDAADKVATESAIMQTKLHDILLKHAFQPTVEHTLRPALGLN